MTRVEKLEFSCNQSIVNNRSSTFYSGDIMHAAHSLISELKLCCSCRPTLVVE